MTDRIGVPIVTSRVRAVCSKEGYLLIVEAFYAFDEHARPGHMEARREHSDAFDLPTGFARDMILTADQAKDYGLIDEIVAPRR